MAMPAIALHAGSDNNTSQYLAFSSWLGATVTTRVTFAAYTHWSDIASPFQLNATASWCNQGPQYQEVITLALLPQGTNFNGGTPSQTEPNAFLTDVTAGTNDTYFKSCAQAIQAKGIANQVIIRLGWECNGNWYPWGIATNKAGYNSTTNSPTNFINAYRHVVALMKQYAPGLRFEWNISRTGSYTGWTSDGGYPGDDVVDYFGCDAYFDYNGFPWLTMRDNGTSGLKLWRARAQAHNKPEAYTEWANDTSANGSVAFGGDDPLFPLAMAIWFAQGNVAYQSYYDTSAWAGNAVIHTGTVTCPRTAQMYQILFSTSWTLQTIAATLVNGKYQPATTPPVGTLAMMFDGTNFLCCVEN